MIKLDENKKNLEAELSDEPVKTQGEDEKAKRDQIAQLAKRRYDLSKEYCKPYFDRFLDNYKHYFLRTIDEALEQDENAYPFYSTLSIPISYQTVETILPRMFSRLPSFSITTEEDNDEQAELQLKELIKFQLQHPYLIDDPIFSRLVTFLKELFICGNAWGEVPWVYKKEKVREMQPYSIQMGLEPSWDNLDILKKYGVEPDWKLVEVDKIMIDAPVFKHHSIFHVFPDPKKKRVSDLGWVIVEDFMTKDQLSDMIKQNPNNYQNIDQIDGLKNWGGDTMKADMSYDNEVASIFGGSDFSDRDTDEPMIKVWFMREKHRFSVIVNEKITIRTGSNPNGDGKIGMILCKDIPIPDQLFAWGEVDPIKKIEDSMSDQANMRNDRVFKDLLDMWKLDPTALIDGEEFIPEPGAIVQMNDLTGLAPIESKSANATAYREYEEWDKIVQNTNGVTDYVSGQNEPGQTDTAEGIGLMQQAANARFQLKLNLFEQIGLKAIGSMYVQRNRIFFSEKTKINTENGTVVADPNQIRMIRGNVNFIVDTNSTESMNTERELKKWLKISEMIAADKPPFNNLSQESIDYVGRKILMAMGEKEPDQILKRNPMPVAGQMPGAEGIGGQIPQVPAGPQLPPELEAAMAESQSGGYKPNGINNQPNPQIVPAGPQPQPAIAG